MSRQVEQFHEGLAAIAPKGMAYPTDPDSVFQRVLKGYAGVLSAHHDYVNSAVEQGMPQLTCTRLEEWEAALGLPDCGVDIASKQVRVGAVIRHLSGWLGALATDNGSTSSVAFIKSVARTLGYEVEVIFNKPFRVGISRVGDRLGEKNPPLYINVVAAPVGYQWSNQPFRVGIHRVGRRLGQRSSNLECVLKKILPARYELIFNYLGG